MRHVVARTGSIGTDRIAYFHRGIIIGICFPIVEGLSCGLAPSIISAGVEWLFGLRRYNKAISCRPADRGQELNRTKEKGRERVEKGRRSEKQRRPSIPHILKLRNDDPLPPARLLRAGGSRKDGMKRTVSGVSSTGISHGEYISCRTSGCRSGKCVPPGR